MYHENWDRPKVTENNAIRLLTDYVAWKYMDIDIMKLKDECTYELKFIDDEELIFNQIFMWLVFQRRDPYTGKLAVEEFVEKYVKDNKDLATKMMKIRNITKDVFLILGNKGDVVFLKDSNNKRFNVRVFPKHQSALYTVGRRVSVRIYPWGKDQYRFASISKLMVKRDDEIKRERGMVTPDVFMNWNEKDFKQDAESIIINTNSSLQSILNKFPSEWIDAICVNLGIKKIGKKNEKVNKIIATLVAPTTLQDIIKTLPNTSLQVLKIVKQNDGVMRYNELVKRYNGDDFSLWWKKNPPKTPIGILRIRGLLMVGKIPKGERLYKTAIIPKELIKILDI